MGKETREGDLARNSGQRREAFVNFSPESLEPLRGGTGFPSGTKRLKEGSGFLLQLWVPLPTGQGLGKLTDSPTLRATPTNTGSVQRGGSSIIQNSECFF